MSCPSKLQLHIQFKVCGEKQIYALLNHCSASEDVVWSLQLPAFLRNECIVSPAAICSRSLLYSNNFEFIVGSEILRSTNREIEWSMVTCHFFCYRYILTKCMSINNHGEWTHIPQSKIETGLPRRNPNTIMHGKNPAHRYGIACRIICKQIPEFLPVEENQEAMPEDLACMTLRCSN
ncbi:hypothetical protein CEXT_423361 [Caerostris extrusa]|uniref:Uncharacterized protein n=1 Tax=Caerostris extrusa TaxID=172846 RepID=A0AAV4WZR5_CAEEX|nr:hypothetical protein CEXT_423361 [Caerostris extrusa]